MATVQIRLARTDKGWRGEAKVGRTEQHHSGSVGLEVLDEACDAVKAKDPKAEIDVVMSRGALTEFAARG